ncbi:MAG: glutathione S-transferase family protein [Oceanospirillaceae bacterium]
MSTTVTLYGLGPSRSFRALWALEEARIAYDYVELDFSDQGDSGRFGSHYSDLNTQGKVPTLVVSDTAEKTAPLVLTESAAIVNYIACMSDDLQLKPEEGTVLRAKYDEMCFFILCELEQPLWTTGKHKFALPEEYRVPEILSTTVAYEFAKAQKTLLALMQGRDFAVGNSFTMADIMLAQTVGWAYRFEFAVDERLLAYRERIIQRDSFVRATQVITK